MALALTWMPAPTSPSCAAAVDLDRVAGLDQAGRGGQPADAGAGDQDAVLLDVRGQLALGSVPHITEPARGGRAGRLGRLVPMIGEKRQAL